MQTSLTKIGIEILKANEHTKQITGNASQMLEERRLEAVKLQKEFGSLLTFRPEILQKCSFHGIILAKEILSKAREEINEYCFTDLAYEIKNKQAEIDSKKKDDAKIDAIAPKYVVKQKDNRFN